MKAITTKYISPTNTRGARVKATDGDTSVTVSYDHASNDPHVEACLALCKKLNWDDNAAVMVRGHTKTGCVFVFYDTNSLLATDGRIRPNIRS